MDAPPFDGRAHVVEGRHRDYVDPEGSRQYGARTEDQVISAARIFGDAGGR